MLQIIAVAFGCLAESEGKSIAEDTKRFIHKPPEIHAESDLETSHKGSSFHGTREFHASFVS